MLSRARLLLNLGDVSAALADLNRLIKLYPEDGELYSLRKQAFEALGDWESAERDQSKIDEISSAEAIWEVRQQIDADRFREAATQADDAIIRWPKSAELHALRATAKWNLGLLDAGRADLTLAIELDPTEANLYESRGRLELVAENYVQAIADFSKAVELNPRLVSAYEGRAFAYHHDNDVENAERDFDQVRKLSERELRE